MNYPEQKEIVEVEDLLPWIDEHFIRLDPFAFQGKRFRDFVNSVCKEFSVDPNGVFCLGSGAVGLSLNPKKVTQGNLKKFDNDSDLDIAIISEIHFETAWRDLRRAVQPTAALVDRDLGRLIGWQKKKFFEGAIIANQILPWLSFGNSWASSLVRLSEQVAIDFDREVDVNIWIFRDYWSVRNYVSQGIIHCRSEVI